MENKIYKETSSKIFMCHFCNNTFVQKHVLQRHINENRCKSKLFNDKIAINNLMGQLKQTKQINENISNMLDFNINNDLFNIFISINPNIKNSIDIPTLKDSINKTIEKNLKVNKTTKKFIFPSGKIVPYQGYENIALRELINLYNEDNIENERNYIPKFKYILNKKPHYYYPDIYIKSENLIIEVKSIWTFKNGLIKNMIKALEVKKAGYKFEFWIYDKNMYKNII